MRTHRQIEVEEQEPALPARAHYGRPELFVCEPAHSARWRQMGRECRRLGLKPERRAGETIMARFTVTLYEIAAHAFTVDARNEEAAVKFARAQFDAQLNSETCISLGLDLGRPATVAPIGEASAGLTMRAA